MPRPRTAPRPLHPGAWWAWVLGLAVVASTTPDVVVLCLLAAVLALVVTARRPHAPWSRSFGLLLRLALLLIALRTVVAVVFGARTGQGTVLVRLPEVPLPDWAAGVTVGGPVTSEALQLALVGGLQLAVLVVAVGAATSLASPYRSLRCLPAALHEVGVALTVAVTFVPQVVETARRVRDARRLRGRPSRGLAGLRGLATPVLEGALERSLRLAESMDARGYGRRGDVPRRTRAVASGALLLALVAAGAAAYGLLGGSSYGPAAAVVAAAAAAVSLKVAGRRVVRTRHRPDPWHLPETLTAGCGAVAAAVAVLADATTASGRLLVLTAVLAAALPAVATPLPEAPTSPTSPAGPTKPAVPRGAVAA